MESLIPASRGVCMDLFVLPLGRAIGAISRFKGLNLSVSSLDLRECWRSRRSLRTIGLEDEFLLPGEEPTNEWSGVMASELMRRAVSSLFY